MTLSCLVLVVRRDARLYGHKLRPPQLCEAERRVSRPEHGSLAKNCLGRGSVQENSPKWLSISNN